MLREHEDPAKVVSLYYYLYINTLNKTVKQYRLYGRVL